VAAAIAILLGTPALAEKPNKLNKPLVDHFVTLNTSKGPIVIKVYFSLVPYTASNFLNLVKRKFYDGLNFHRVEDWVVQGGDPVGNGTGNFIDPETGKPRFLHLEVTPKLNHDKPGVVAMARSQDPNSASCQFYILKQPASYLNGKYAVFGQVVEGMQTVNRLQIGDMIVSARITDPAASEDRPSSVDRPAPSGDVPSGSRHGSGSPVKTGSDSGF
jgi:cyclophilin family peptidyl-prolyl cis-trans isomerase